MQSLPSSIRVSRAHCFGTGGIWFSEGNSSPWPSLARTYPLFMKAPNPPSFHFPCSTTHLRPILNPIGSISALFRVQIIGIWGKQSAKWAYLKINSSIFPEFGTFEIFYQITVFRIRPFQAPFDKMRVIWIMDEIYEITSPKWGCDILCVCRERSRKFLRHEQSFPDSTMSIALC